MSPLHPYFQKRYLYIILLFFINKALTETIQKEVCITIFVHGSIGLRAYLAPRTLIQLFQDDIMSSHYERGVSYIRNNPFFYKNQAMEDVGLKSISLEKIEGGSSLFAHLFDEINKKEKSENHYYVFGWSGLVSHKTRLEEARILFHYLVSLVQCYKKKGITPRIRCVGYSHGGNLLLNLARVWEEDYQCEPLFTIDELIFIAMPVQKETDFLILSDLFKKIYHFYSRTDRIQKLDFFSTKRFFSHRRFRNTPRFTLPSKLMQIEVKIKIPLCRSSLIRPKTRYISRSPGHIEWWFFGWPTSRSGYRKTFPFFPLPLALFVGKFVEMIEDAAPLEKSIVFELFPTNECAYIRKRYSQKKIMIPFVKQEVLQTLQQEALSYKPELYTMKEYIHAICNAIVMAQPKKHMHSRKRKCLCGS